MLMLLSRKEKGANAPLILPTVKIDEKNNNNYCQYTRDYCRDAHLWRKLENWIARFVVIYSGIRIIIHIDNVVSIHLLFLLTRGYICAYQPLNISRSIRDAVKLGDNVLLCPGDAGQRVVFAVFCRVALLRCVLAYLKILNNTIAPITRPTTTYAMTPAIPASSELPLSVLSQSQSPQSQQ